MNLCLSTVIGCTLFHPSTSHSSMLRMITKKLYCVRRNGKEILELHIIFTILILIQKHSNLIKT